MNISVIIPCYKDDVRLKKCLLALNDQTINRNEFEVLVVNNNPRDSISIDFVVDFDLRILNENKVGSYAARNKGIINAKGDIVAFTDSDCIPSDNWLFYIYSFFRDNPSFYRIAGDIRFFKSNKNTMTELHYEEVFCLDQKKHVELRHAAATANMAVRKKIFENVGLFRSDIKSAEDLDWGKRAYKRGYDISYSKKAYVYHPVRTKREIIKKSIRSAGGYMDIKKTEGNISFVKFVLGKVIPFNTINRIFSRDDISLPIKFKVFCFRAVVRFYVIVECVLVLLGKNSERS